MIAGIVEIAALLPFIDQRSMFELKSQEAFLRDPACGFVAGRNWLFFSVDRRLYGYSIWSRPTPEDIHALVAVLEHELVRPLHVALVDLGDVEIVATEAFDALASYTIRNRARLAEIVEHAAIVRPRGMVGAIVAGFFDIASRPFPLSFWSSTEEALRRLGAEDPSVCAEAIAAARARVSGEAALVRALRVHLAAELLSPSAAKAARALEVSERTLQRRLAEENTTFAAEVLAVRLAAAERLLLESEEPVTAVALTVGFKASQHFATVFKRHAGCTPSEYRAQKRAGGG